MNKSKPQRGQKPIDLLSSNENKDPEDSDDEVDLTLLPAMGAPPRAAAPPPVQQKPVRDYKAEGVADEILAMLALRWTDRDGVIDTDKMRITMRRALGSFDPSFKELDTAKQIVDALATGMAAQNKSRASEGVNRAIVDALSVAVSQKKISKRDVAKQLGVSRKRLRERDDVDFSESALRKRRTRSDATPPLVVKAMREFIYCYCRYLEKTYVCLLTRQAMWELYNQFHDKEGAYFCKGRSSLAQPHHTHSRTQTGSPEWGLWQINRIKASMAGSGTTEVEYIQNVQRPQAVTRSIWYNKWPKEVESEKWRSCACQLCTEV